jgi:hypothetical protein
MVFPVFASKAYRNFDSGASCLLKIFAKVGIFGFLLGNRQKIAVLGNATFSGQPGKMPG